MLNFDGDFDRHVDDEVICEQILSTNVQRDSLQEKPTKLVTYQSIFIRFPILLGLLLTQPATG